MVMYQALGETRLDLRKIRRKLERVLGPEGADQAWSTVRDTFTQIKDAVKLPGGFVESSKELWGSRSDAQKQRIFQQALDSTGEWQDQETDV